MPTTVGVSESDLDAQRTFVRDLDGKLDAAVAKCFAGKPDAAEWKELHGRVADYLSGWTLFVFTEMFYGVGQNLIAQLNAWVPRVTAAGCPVDAPGPAPTPAPTILQQAAAFVPTSIEQGLVALALLWFVGEKIKRAL